MNLTATNISAIIPAAGRATRLGKLPFSKELSPVGFKNGKLKTVSSYLLDALSEAEADQVHFIIRNGKWDIPKYYGSNFNKTPLCYHLAEYGYGVPFTVNQAHPFVKDHIVLLGFPDILFKPKNAYKYLIDELMNSESSLTLGVFPVSKPEKWDMVELDKKSFVQEIAIKPISGNYKYGWVIAAWKPDFSNFLNKFVDSSLKMKTTDELFKNELHFGDVIIAAIKSGMKVKGVVIENGKCLDTGTPDEMNKATEFINS